MAVFSATFSGITVSAAQDIFELVAPSNSRVRIREITFGQSSDSTDANSDMIGIQVIRGHTTSGSGGASVTPANREPWGRASEATVERNNTTVAQDGSPEILIADTFNNMAGYHWPGGDDPTMRSNYSDGYIYLNLSQRLVVRITAPAGAGTDIDCNGTLVWEEIGKTGN